MLVVVVAVVAGAGAGTWLPAVAHLLLVHHVGLNMIQCPPPPPPPQYAERMEPVLSTMRPLGVQISQVRKLHLPIPPPPMYSVPITPYSVRILKRDANEATD